MTDRAKELRDGILQELNHELQQHCIIWPDPSDRDIDSIHSSYPVKVEISDRAERLLEQYAIALEISQRDGGKV